MNNNTQTMTDPVYEEIDKYTSDVYFQLESQEFLNLNEHSTTRIKVDIPCSPSGTEPLTYSLGNLGLNVPPSWVSLDSPNSQLVLSTPGGNASVTYSFSIDTVTSRSSRIYQKPIYLRVIPCTLNNCLE